MHLFLSYICSTFFFFEMLFYNNKDKIKKCFIVVINILLIIKKRIGGKYAALLGDFALEPSENSEHCFSQNLLC